MEKILDGYGDYLGDLHRQLSPFNDYEKTQISNQLGTYGSELRKLFDEDTLSDMHPNIKRINDALSGKNVDIEDIMKVDLYNCENGRLVEKNET